MPLHHLIAYLALILIYKNILFDYKPKLIQFIKMLAIISILINIKIIFYNRLARYLISIHARACPFLYEKKGMRYLGHHHHFQRNSLFSATSYSILFGYLCLDMFNIYWYFVVNRRYLGRYF